jgi:RAQPRD family integrative conjugative element protein
MRIIQLLVVLTSIHVGDIAIADSTEELKRLQSVYAELVQLQSELELAEAAADPDTRIHFRYDWLRRDLAIIRHGIQAQIDASISAPINRPRLRGDYRR